MSLYPIFNTSKIVCKRINSIKNKCKQKIKIILLHRLLLNEDYFNLNNEIELHEKIKEYYKNHNWGKYNKIILLYISQDTKYDLKSILNIQGLFINNFKIKDCFVLFSHSEFNQEFENIKLWNNILNNKYREVPFYFKFNTPEIKNIRNNPNYHFNLVHRSNSSNSIHYYNLLYKNIEKNKYYFPVKNNIKKNIKNNLWYGKKSLIKDEWFYNSADDYIIKKIPQSIKQQFYNDIAISNYINNLSINL
jgi:hypothetical protein